VEIDIFGWKKGDNKKGGRIKRGKGMILIKI
jgi:hypothetical protein